MTPKEKLVLVRKQLKIARDALMLVADGDAHSPATTASTALEDIDHIDAMKLDRRQPFGCAGYID
jgi:hypothetical protein